MKRRPRLSHEALPALPPELAVDLLRAVGYSKSLARATVSALCGVAEARALHSDKDLRP